MDANHIGKRTGGRHAPNTIFASEENELGQGHSTDPMTYAEEYDKAALAVYDPTQLTPGEFHYQYIPQSPKALLAYITF
jgi:hypothetical protein